jgi:hypothetical protein
VPLSDLYRSARITIHQAGRSRALIFSEEHGQALEVDASVARLLSLCQGCKTLDGHAAALARTGLGDAHALAATLQSLAMSGLLRSCADLLPPPDVQASSVDARPIRTVAVITAGRPSILARGLESFARHLDAQGQPARLLVVDGSRDAADQAANRNIVAELHRRTGRQGDYVGEREAAALRERLAADQDAPRELLDFALTAGTIGANRNLVLLLTAGEHILMADDDIVCEPWAPNGRADGVALWGHTEPQDSEFFAARDDLRHAAAWVPDVDLVGAHAARLAQPLPAALASAHGGADLGEACGHLIGALVERRAPAVRLTFTGIAGDAGTYCPYTRLFATGPTQARLASSRDVFERALRSREVLRAVSRTTITHDSRCMAGCMGLINTGLVPPFLPVGRNEDGVFGIMLTALDPLALAAHLPVGVVHDSGRPAVYEDRSMRSASESRLSDLLILLTRAAMQGALESDAGARLARLADGLVAVAGLEPRGFVQHATRMLLDARAQQLARIEAMVSRPAEYPPYWRAALEEYRRTITRSLARPDFFLPVEFHDAGSVDAGFELLQRFVAQFAALLGVWPALGRAMRGIAGSRIWP